MPTKEASHLQKQFLTGVPFPYLLNESEFYGFKFFINQQVLIPRPETEQLVDMIIQSKKKFNQMLDVGTGSGVILLSLLAAGAAQRGVGGDLSPAALAVAQINAQRLRLNDRVTLLESDRLTKIKGKFDLIVSNPPYIKPQAHRDLVHPNVDNFEPSQALYIPDGVYSQWFFDFFTQVKGSLTAGGSFLMEGHEHELQSQSTVLRELGFLQVKVLKDWGGSDRFLEAQAPA